MASRKILVHVRKWHFVLVLLIAGFLSAVSVVHTWRTGVHLGSAPKAVFAPMGELVSPGFRDGPVVHRFVRMMDSLRGNVAGRMIYDSIMRVRPGLLDSARLIDKLYSVEQYLK